MSRVEHLAQGVTLYLGDCADILPQLGTVDAIVTDPPYGIRVDENPVRGIHRYGVTQWDRERPPPALFKLMLSISKYQIIWGGNYFTDLLPPSMQWLIWDKGQRHFSLADMEMAWSSQKAASRIFDYPRGRALLDGKEHPTQKPIEVMRWCLSFLPDTVKHIVDPFLGAGSTGVAVVSRGLKFTGIEIHEPYFDIACRRISEALKQPDLFIEKPAPAKQEALGL